LPPESLPEELPALEVVPVVVQDPLQEEPVVVPHVEPVVLEVASEEPDLVQDAELEVVADLAVEVAVAEEDHVANPDSCQHSCQSK
jgi:hypothetical protein